MTGSVSALPARPTTSRKPHAASPNGCPSRARANATVLFRSPAFSFPLPGESRGPPFNRGDAEKWIPAFAGKRREKQRCDLKEQLALPRRGRPRGRPVFRVFQERPHFFVLARLEPAHLRGDSRDIPPGGERVQRDALGGEARFGMREDAVIEDHERMGN